MKDQYVLERHSNLGHVSAYSVVNPIVEMSFCDVWISYKKVLSIRLGPGMTRLNFGWLESTLSRPSSPINVPIMYTYFIARPCWNMNTNHTPELTGVLRAAAGQNIWKSRCENSALQGTRVPEGGFGKRWRFTWTQNESYCAGKESFSYLWWQKIELYLHFVGGMDLDELALIPSSPGFQFWT